MARTHCLLFVPSFPSARNGESGRSSPHNMATLEEATRRALRPPLAPAKETGHGTEGGRGHKKPLTTNSYEGVSYEPKTRAKDARSTVGQRGPRRRRKQHRIRIPKAIRQAVLELAGRLRSEFGADFAANRVLKHDVAQLLRAELPPAPRRPGRPGYATVTAAIRLRAELRRSHPQKSHKQIWREVYRKIIPRYGDLPLLERLAAEHQLHSRVHWRMNARRRARRSAKTTN